MRREWSVFALAGCDAIFDYIESENPHAAVNVDVDDRIGRQARHLKQFADSGCPGRIKGTCELVIQNTLYIAAYRTMRDTVRILRVLHGTQQWPDDMPGAI